MKRHATANWKGSGKEGKGILSTQSIALSNAKYSYGSRFEEGVGTNPEELVAAAHAGCFSMKLSFVLGNFGVVPEDITTKCTVTLGDGIITSSHLDVKVKAAIDEQKFQECINDAKQNCPISKSLNTTITASAELV